ncbi:hypothetical protein [Nocardia goodfellowii]|uniref:Uncharacterized protein n=1 Tax=Nocardia goodfellowii TaxID=882446 RepID=A0ABS4QK87_9NOCA|nr:hypothetical protein [Nocardia goodfellowii]MBP2192100.1 hypothetical protein [Nocardia goodfellowii]
MSDAEPISWDHLKTRRPSDADRTALRDTLVERAVAVRQHGWDDYREVWTPGEMAGVAYLLQDSALLEELDEHEGSVLTRFAGALYGFAGARKEIESGLVETQAWFAAARAELATRSSGTDR